MTVEGQFASGIVDQRSALMHDGRRTAHSDTSQFLHIVPQQGSYVPSV